MEIKKNENNNEGRDQTPASNRDDRGARRRGDSTGALVLVFLGLVGDRIRPENGGYIRIRTRLRGRVGIFLSCGDRGGNERKTPGAGAGGDRTGYVLVSENGSGDKKEVGMSGGKLPGEERERQFWEKREDQRREEARRWREDGSRREEWREIKEKLYIV